MAWWEDPDPYTYERIGADPNSGRPVYVVSRDGVELGVIEPWRASTDTMIAGSRQRRPGRGADEFRPAGVHRVSWPRRRDAARQFDPEHGHSPMTVDEVAMYRRRYQSSGIEPPPTKDNN